MKYADLHIHSIYSTSHIKKTDCSLLDKILLDSRVSIDQILQTAKQKNLSAIAISDHNTTEGSLIAQKKAFQYGLTVIPAVEISAKSVHILAYGIKKDIPSDLSIEKTISLIHQQNAVAVLAHPYDFNPQRSTKIKTKLNFFNYHFDAIEVASCVTGFSKKAVKLAKKMHLPQVAGSDAHCQKAISYAVTAFPDSCIIPSDYIKAIKNNKTFPILNPSLKINIWVSTAYQMWFKNLLPHFSTTRK